MLGDEVIDRFYVSERKLSWFRSTPFTHVVRDKESDDRVVCAATDYGCGHLAAILNNALTPFGERSNAS